MPSAAQQSAAVNMRPIPALKAIIAGLQVARSPTHINDTFMNEAKLSFFRRKKITGRLSATENAIV